MGMRVGGGGAEVWSSLLLLCAFLGSNTSRTGLREKRWGNSRHLLQGAGVVCE